METSEFTTIEVNGVKMEVDLRHARRIENIRIGHRVKLLAKGQYAGSKVSPGIVVGFEPFKELPTIVVAYIDQDWSKAAVKFAYINNKSSDFDMIAAVDDDMTVDKDAIFKMFDRDIATKRREIEAIEEQKAFFETNFRAFWAAFDRSPA